MRYTVTGATGLVGNNLVRYLLERNHQIRILMRPTSNTQTVAGLNVDTVYGDLADQKTLEKLTDNTDGVFHLAAHIWFGRSHLDESKRINVEATDRLARQCLQNQIRLVHVSTVDALAAGALHQPANESCIDPPKSTCVYTTTKRQAEKLVLDYVRQGLDAVIINPCLMFGPYDWKPSSGQMILAIANGWVPAAPGGGVSVLDARDATTAIEAAMRVGRTGERYILAGTNLTYLELWRMMAREIGKPGPLFGLPNWFAPLVGGMGDLAALLTRRESNVNSAALAMGQLYHYYESSKAMAELGYSFSPVQSVIKDAWNWLRENVNGK